MNSQNISHKFYQYCNSIDKSDEAIKKFLDNLLIPCKNLTNVNIDKLTFFTFLELLCNNYAVFNNNLLLMTVLNLNVDKFIKFKHFIDHVENLVINFNWKQKNSCTIYSLEYVKIIHKLSCLKENLLYYVNKLYPDKCPEMKSNLYDTFDDEVEATILYSFAQSLEIEKIENHITNKRIEYKKRKLNNANNKSKIIENKTSETNKQENNLKEVIIPNKKSRTICEI